MVTINKSMGAHSLKTGAEWRQYREKSTFSANAQTGQFNFGTTWTRGPLDNSAGAPGSLGQSFAAFLLGLPENSSFVNVDDGYDETVLDDRHLPAGRLAGRAEADAELRPALRVRDRR